MLGTTSVDISVLEITIADAVSGVNSNIFWLLIVALVLLVLLCRFAGGKVAPNTAGKVGLNTDI